MFNTNNASYSPADLAAVMGNNNRGYDDGFGGGFAWWIIILLLFGWGDGNGFGNRGNGSTKDEIAYSFDFNNLESGIRDIQSNLCSGFQGVNTNLLTGFAGVNDAITQSTISDMQTSFGLQNAINGSTNTISSQLQNMASQQAQCCCENKNLITSSFADLNYNLASQACENRRTTQDAARDIIDANAANTRSIMDFLVQTKIDQLTSENASLRGQISQAEQNAYLVNALGAKVPQAAYIVANPYTGTSYGCGATSVCGCA